ncbi:type II secretion system F family protein [Candidatus Woesearchaeota archaeon]|nr:type II secretion system F family protein [Candidatus Woesearchaeota archaeon]
MKPKKTPKQKEEKKPQKKKEDKAQKDKDSPTRESIRKALEFGGKKQRDTYRHRTFLRYYLQNAGLKAEPRSVNIKLLIASLVLVTLFNLWVAYQYVLEGSLSASFLTYAVPVNYLLGTPLALAVLWLAFLGYLEYRIYTRTKAIENSLPDYLQLAAANIRAGMPVDQALWSAVRPKFGILAKEMETVAKDVLAGHDLNTALVELAGKYNSPMLYRAIHILIEGIEAGGEVGDLLTKIAIDIQEIQLMKKEMAASMTTYTIFITFSTIIAAPLLFALSGQLLNVISSITSSLDLTNLQGTANVPLVFSQVGISQTDFRIFAVVVLVISATFTSFIVSMIRNGRATSGLKTVLPFILVSLLIYAVAVWLFTSLFSGFF